MNWNQLNSAFTLFLSLLVEAVPFLLLGVLFSGLLLFFVDERKLVRLMPKNPFWVRWLVAVSVFCSRFANAAMCL